MTLNLDMIFDDPQKIIEAKDFVGEVGWVRLKKFMILELERMMIDWKVFIQNKDHEMIGSQAHMLKSSAKHMGLERLANLMEQIERQLKHSANLELDFMALEQNWSLIEQTITSSINLLKD